MPPPVNFCGCPAASEREREGERLFLGSVPEARWRALLGGELEIER
jgi:hypothetical protein